MIKLKHVTKHTYTSMLAINSIIIGKKMFWNNKYMQYFF